MSNMSPEEEGGGGVTSSVLSSPTLVVREGDAMPSSFFISIE
jgi:hypothetical protein